MSVLSKRLETVRSEAGSMEEVQARIAQLQRQKELEETGYRYYSSKLEQARLDETLGAGKLANISEVQAPSVPRRDRAKRMKPLLICLLGGVVGGIALAFLLELFLDPTVRRPVDLVGKLRLPLILSIPMTQRNGRSQAPKDATGGGVPATEQSLVSAILADTPGKRTQAEIAAWDAGHHLRPYHEALRDRLMTYFEINNLTHKPKLVAITGCSPGSGVTTLAAGLAATLSETGEGNVLLVDMNQEQGAAHPFFKGQPACDLADLLEQEKRGQAMIQDKLYMAAENLRDRLPNALPNRFSSLVPKLKASDYDYIIFDMPPITGTSITPRLARFMDMVLLVVESEKTSRDVLKQAGSLLAESKANVQAVLNKSRKYVPAWLQQEL
jgi:Mrp family chromosome partitioning ATPase